MNPALFILVGGVLLGGIGLYQLESGLHAAAPVGAPRRRKWQFSRQLWGFIGGSLAGLGVLGLIPALGVQGNQRVFMLTLAATVWWTITLVVPRLPLMQAQRQQKAIRLALPAAVNQWRIALDAGEKLLPMMERYIAVPRPERAALQEVITHARSAIDAGQTHTIQNPLTGELITERMLFSDTLLAEAKKTRCTELVTVMTILANADREGGIRTAVPALKRTSVTLETIIHHEIDELLTKRSLKLIAVSAPAVVGGVLLLLFVAAAGNDIPF